ncbi:U5 small nuclear ribonucleoprotein TSSC4 [Tautogolabrus adspersus]
MAPFDPELDHSDDDDNEEVCAPAGLRNQAQFSLRGGSSAFSNRSHSIFDCLDNVARPPSSTSSCPSSSSSSSSVNQQKDGVFARPQAPPPSRKTNQPPLSPPNPVKRRGTPDYLLNPERWTHYSLEDTSETSDHGNTRAALSFLTTLQERKEEDRKQKERKEEEEEEAERSCSDSSPCDLQQKMIFSRPSRPRREQPMVRSREKETHLSHLQEEEVEGRETQKAGERRTEAEEKHAENQTKEEEQEQRQREKEEEEKAESGPVFTSFRRISSKNYRRSSVKEEY